LKTFALHLEKILEQFGVKINGLVTIGKWNHYRWLEINLNDCR